jgi:iron complex outermembrane recepter protein
MFRSRNALIAGLTCIAITVTGAFAETFNIPAGRLDDALSKYSTQTGVQLVVLDDAVKGVRTKGVAGNLSPDEALTRILSGTGFSIRRKADAVMVVRDTQASDAIAMHIAAATAPTVSGAALETVTVTSSKIGGDVQNIPISITALSQEQLTATQTAGGPDLVKQVPNLTFTKTNFTGYSINIRGIGTQAISVTTDPAVAVAFNDIPFIRNHFFEQEFYDVSQVQVLRGPQGTLYGRNATAGVVNLSSAKPTDQFEAMASLDVGNYGNRRPEGMINIPIVDDRLDVRIAGEWTKRQGYSFNTSTNQRIDGRDLWSGRVSIAWKPAVNVQTYIVWEHFSEDDDRMRTAKQLCKTAPIPASVGGVSTSVSAPGGSTNPPDYISQGCLPSSLYSADAFEVPNGYSLSYYSGLSDAGMPFNPNFDVYSETTQSRNLRVIESSINPIYRAKNDTVELNTDYQVTPVLTFTSQTGFNQDFLWSTEDYNRFDSAPGAFQTGTADDGYGVILPDPNGFHVCNGEFGSCSGVPAGTPCTPTSSNDFACRVAGVFCDPQLGCSDRLVAQDLSDEHAWQLSQEFRLVSNFIGPLNFSVGGNYLHYETEENYYVFINTLTMYAVNHGALGAAQYVPGVFDDHQCLAPGYQFKQGNPGIPSNYATCRYIDPNPLTSLNNEGRNYFLSQNPYVLNSYAGFGEVYYNVISDLKLTGGVRWTEDRKHFTDIPSELLVGTYGASTHPNLDQSAGGGGGYGYPITGVVDQQWDKLTGRAAVNWTPKLDFTDQTLIYGSYAHGYKAGGANPPGATFFTAPVPGSDQVTINPIHPLTFKPEFVDAFELGSKNTLLDGALTFNADLFYYNYENYQISRIVDRTAINDNFDAHAKGAEIESTWEPIPGLRLNFAGGWEDTALAKGDHSVDLIDRTAGNPDWFVVKPTVTQASNCILPVYVVATLFAYNGGGNISAACVEAYNGHFDPLTDLPYTPNPAIGYYGALLPESYPGFDPVSPTATNNGAGPAPNNGQGFDKNLSGNELPNAPPFTVSFGAQYTLPITTDWAGTLRGDYYWQDYSWARVFNDNPYDRLRGYTNVNLTLILTNQNGWQVMLYDKNVFNTTAITGDFLNSDDTGLTTNVFLTDPKLIGVRVTKNW